MTACGVVCPQAMFSPTVFHGMVIAVENLLPSGRVWSNLVTISFARTKAFALSSASNVSGLSPTLARSWFTRFATCWALPLVFEVSVLGLEDGTEDEVEGELETGGLDMAGRELDEEEGALLTDGLLCCGLEEEEADGALEDEEAAGAFWEEVSSLGALCVSSCLLVTEEVCSDATDDGSRIIEPSSGSRDESASAFSEEIPSEMLSEGREEVVSSELEQEAVESANVAHNIIKQIRFISNSFGYDWC